MFQSGRYYLFIAKVRSDEEKNSIVRKRLSAFYGKPVAMAYILGQAAVDTWGG